MTSREAKAEAGRILRELRERYPLEFVAVVVSALKIEIRKLQRKEKHDDNQT